MPLTIYTLLNEFPLVFVCRVLISLMLLALMIWGALLLYKLEKIDKTQLIASTVFSVYFVLMLYFTVLGRYSQSFYRGPLPILETYRVLKTGFDWHIFCLTILNFLMFVPVGFMFPMVIKHRGKYMFTILISVAMTFGIEVAQYFSRTGTFEWDDIVLNIIGAMVGALMFIIYEVVFNCRKGRHYYKK